MSNIIASAFGPKQRITRVFGYIMVKHREDYSVHRQYQDNGDLEDGHYNLTEEQAWEIFKQKVDYLFSFGPGTWEK